MPRPRERPAGFKIHQLILPGGLSGNLSSSSSAKRLNASTNDKYSLGKQNVRGIMLNCFASFPPNPVKRCKFFFRVSFRVNSRLPGKWFTRWKWNNDSYLIRGRDQVHKRFHYASATQYSKGRVPLAYPLHMRGWQYPQLRGVPYIDELQSIGHYVARIPIFVIFAILFTERI